MTFRGFISVDMEDTRELQGLHRELRAIGGGLKTVDIGIVHVTLKFLGDTEESLVPRIVAAMEQAATGVAPFDVALRGVGAFPSTSNIRVVWVGMENAEQLASVALKLDEMLIPLGFHKEERPFSPHLTMGRMKDPRGSAEVRGVIERHASDAYGIMPVRSVRLKKSVLGPRGPAYTTLAEVRLQAL